MHRHIRRSKSVLKQSDKQYGLAEDLNDQVNQSDRAVEKNNEKLTKYYFVGYFREKQAGESQSSYER